MAEEKKPVIEATLVEVPTQMAIAIKLEDGTIVDRDTLLLKIYNMISKISRSLS